MPKFPKGSEEAKQHMKELRERRKNKPLTELQISRNNKKTEVQNILNEALDKYFMAGSAVVEFPDKVVKLDKKGNAKVMETLTKTGNLKKVNGESVIKLESGNDLNIKTKGRQYHDSEAVIIPTQIITNDKPIKSKRKKIEGIEKSNDDTIDFKNIDIQPEKTKDVERNNLRNEYDELINKGNELIEQLKILNKEFESTKKRNEKSSIKKQIAEIDSLIYKNKNDKQQIETITGFKNV
jgi:hypothetical protein